MQMNANGGFQNRFPLYKYPVFPYTETQKGQEHHLYMTKESLIPTEEKP